MIPVKARRIPPLNKASIPTKEMVKQLDNIFETVDAYVDRLKGNVVMNFLSRNIIKDESMKDLGGQIKQDVLKWHKFFSKNYPDSYFDNSSIYKEEWRKFWANLNRINAAGNEVWGRALGTRDSVWFLRVFMGRWKKQLDRMKPLFPKTRSLPFEDKDDVEEYLLDMKEERLAVASYQSIYKAAQIRGMQEAYRMAGKTKLSTEKQMRKFAKKYLPDTDLSKKGDYINFKHEEVYIKKKGDGNKKRKLVNLNASFDLLYDMNGNFVLANSPVLNGRVYSGSYKTALSLIMALKKTSIALKKAPKREKRFVLAKKVIMIIAKFTEVSKSRVMNVSESEIDLNKRKKKK